MPVKINSTGGGAVTLEAASTASEFTHTLPAVSGTVVTTGSSAVVTPAMLSTGAPSWAANGNFSFNSGFGSVGVAYACRAWVNFNGTGTVAIRGSGNVTSITDHGVGDYTVNFTNAMPDINYVTNALGSGPVSVAHCLPFVNVIRGTYTTSAVSVGWFITTNSGNRADPDWALISVFR